MFFINIVIGKKHRALLNTIIHAGIDEQVLADGLAEHIQSFLSELERSLFQRE